MKKNGILLGFLIFFSYIYYVNKLKLKVWNHNLKFGVLKGDLLKPASWKSPAKHSRGNIFDGSDKWNFYGPNYL